MDGVAKSFHLVDAVSSEVEEDTANNLNDQPEDQSNGAMDSQLNLEMLSQENDLNRNDCDKNK
jgi:hypothetical protein